MISTYAHTNLLYLLTDVPEVFQKIHKNEEGAANYPIFAQLITQYLLYYPEISTVIITFLQSGMI